MNAIAESAAIARRNRADNIRSAEEAAGRARELRRLARVAGGGPEAEAWLKQAAFLDQVEDAHRRQAAGLDNYLASPSFETSFEGGRHPRGAA